MTTAIRSLCFFMDVFPCVIERLLARGPSQTESYADGIAGQWPLSLRRHVLHFLRLGGAGREQEAQVGAGRNIARAHAHIFGRQVGARGKTADGEMLAVLLARGQRFSVSLVHPRMVVLAG